MEYSVTLFVTLMVCLLCSLAGASFPHHGNGCNSQGQGKNACRCCRCSCCRSAPVPAPQGMQPEIVAAITAALSEEVGISSRSMNIVNIKKI